jgi:hypothetical protein
MSKYRGKNIAAAFNNKTRDFVRTNTLGNTKTSYRFLDLGIGNGRNI